MLLFDVLQSEISRNVGRGTALYPNNLARGEYIRATCRVWNRHLHNHARGIVHEAKEANSAARQVDHGHDVVGKSFSM